MTLQHVTFFPDWERFAEMCIGIIRTETGRDPHDRGLQERVGELATQSDGFRGLWPAHNVRGHGDGTKHASTIQSRDLSSRHMKNWQSRPNSA